MFRPYNDPVRKQVLMNYHIFFFGLLLLSFVGCGEDTGRSRRTEVVNPPLTEDDFVVPSQIHRTREASVLTAREVRDEIVAGALPVEYRQVPLIALDDEGSGVNVRTRTALGRPAVNCGTAAGLTISARMDDCSTVNGASATWSSINGAAGESTWRLVAKAGTQEIWLDTRTGLLWSDVVATTNWCNAAGNSTQETGTTIDCKNLGTNFSCVGKTLLIGDVTWRLPTRNDFLQADLNGLRSALKEVTDQGLWTGTVNSTSTNRSEAWVYRQAQGTLESAPMDSDRHVRCVGAAAL